jgi:hypothetical protein
MVISRRVLEDTIKSFPDIKKYMYDVAQEKLNYHKILVEKIIDKYKHPDLIKKMIEARMKD